MNIDSPAKNQPNQRVTHLLNFEYLTASIPVYNCDDAVYFGYNAIRSSLNLRTKRAAFSVKAREYVEVCTLAGQPADTQLVVLGEAAVKFLLPIYNQGLNRMLIDTVIPYALRFIIRRDLRIMRDDISRIQKQIARMPSISACIMEVAEHAEADCIVGSVVNVPQDTPLDTPSSASGGASNIVSHV